MSGPQEVGVVEGWRLTRWAYGPVITITDDYSSGLILPKAALILLFKDAIARGVVTMADLA